MLLGKNHTNHWTHLYKNVIIVVFAFARSCELNQIFQVVLRSKKTDSSVIHKNNLLVKQKVTLIKARNLL